MPFIKQIRPHPLKTLYVRRAHIRDRWSSCFLYPPHQLCTVQLAIAPPSLQDLALLFNTEVFPSETWIHNISIQTQDFVMADRTRIGEIVDSRVP